MTTTWTLPLSYQLSRRFAEIQTHRPSVRESARSPTSGAKDLLSLKLLINRRIELQLRRCGGRRSVQDIKALLVGRIRNWWCCCEVCYYAFISPHILREKVQHLQQRLQHLTA